MLNLLNSITIGHFAIALEGLDHMNDYSLVYDYRVTITDKRDGASRCWELGTKTSRADAALSLCCKWARAQ
jgi:hypothetical protein